MSRVAVSVRVVRADSVMGDMMYNPLLSRDQRDRLLVIHQAMRTLHDTAHAVTAEIQATGQLAGPVIDVQLAISDVMTAISKAVFLPDAARDDVADAAQLSRIESSACDR